MTLTEQMSSDVAAVETEMPFPFSFEGKDYIGQRTPIVDKLEMQDAGFEQGYDFTLEVRTDQFSDEQPAPKNQAIIKIADIEYCIVGCTPDQAGVVNTYAVKQKT